MNIYARPFSTSSNNGIAQLDIQTADLEEYYRLKTLFRTEKITENERENLIELNNLIEIAPAKRMGYVLQLEQLRQVCLEKIMLDSGIKHLYA